MLLLPSLRRSAWQHVGGIDETMSEPGECGIMSDFELCTRMWLAGYQVRGLRLQDACGPVM